MGVEGETRDRRAVLSGAHTPWRHPSTLQKAKLGSESLGLTQGLAVTEVVRVQRFLGNRSVPLPLLLRATKLLPSE